jgi:3,4-dihydroxy-9,10-secoandrosta-1,3,5(10)-triene-9,17-dione 4,5-dioxygenase
MTGVRSLGYLRLQSPVVDEWRTFGSEVLGMMAVDGADPDSAYFRLDDRPPRFVVSPAETNGIGALGFEVADGRELSELVDQVKGAGIEVTDGSGAEADERRVEALVHFSDPHGIPIEVYFGPILDHVRLDTPLVSGFVTGNMGMGHAVIAAPDIAASMRFYADVLGFRLRSSMRVPMGPDQTMMIRFLGCNPRHHTVALLAADMPGALVHFMLEVDSIDDVGMALDRCAARGIDLQANLGRHTNDRVLSTYIVGPGGVAVEIGTGGIRVDDTTWTTDEITAVSFWGHKFQPGATEQLKVS